MNREVHVRFCEGLGVKFPRATRPLIYTWLEFTQVQDIECIERWILNHQVAAMVSRALLLLLC
jgi:hypothetical protein